MRYSAWKDNFKKDMETFIENYEHTEFSDIKDCFDYINEYCTDEEFTEAKSTMLINNLVKFLISDPYWTRENIGKADLSQLKELIEYIEEER
jgi:hypothetical protein